jgi:hypothetical protein
VSSFSIFVWCPFADLTVGFSRRKEFGAIWLGRIPSFDPKDRKPQVAVGRSEVGEVESEQRRGSAANIYRFRRPVEKHGEPEKVLFRIRAMRSRPNGTASKPDSDRRLKLHALACIGDVPALSAGEQRAEPSSFGIRRELESR